MEGEIFERKRSIGETEEDKSKQSKNREKHKNDRTIWEYVYTNQRTNRSVYVYVMVSELYGMYEAKIFVKLIQVFS